VAAKPALSMNDKDILDVTAGHPERFVPHLMGGRMIDAEHRGRYWWASALVAGKTVLDAGCGTGYGTSILAAAGATSVVGIDRAAHVIEFASARAQPAVTFRVGDLLEIPFPERTFDVVVCFEAIEHVATPEAALDELRRVLNPAGVLAISSPNRDVYVGGNPHHHHEFTPAELEAALEARFEHVRLVRQHSWLTTAILEDAAFQSGDGSPLDGTIVHKVNPAEAGREAFTLALGSNAPLPAPPSRIVLGEDATLHAPWHARLRSGLYELAHRRRRRHVTS
jgi:SAM-dependent methyltransferase